MAHHGARGPTVFGLVLSTMARVRVKIKMRARVNVAHVDQPCLALDTSTFSSSLFLAASKSPVAVLNFASMSGYPSLIIRLGRMVKS